MTIPFNDKGRALLTSLAGFNNGTDTYTRHAPHRSMLMTDGVIYLCHQAGAYWLTDIVASYQHTPKVRREPFQVWTLYVRDPSTKYGNGIAKVTYAGKTLPSKYDAVITMTDGNNDTAPIITQRISFTDFPLSSITLWLENNVLMLPGER